MISVKCKLVYKSRGFVRLAWNTTTRAILDDTTKKPKLQTVQASVSMLKFMAVQLQKACRVARRKNMTAPIRFAAMHLKITRHLLGRFRQSGGVWPQYTAYKYKPI